ncbi:hypothetical protein RvY_17879 [Ramazzottius varieornatus]|uniref:Uncharacterized protein n=1 Tax=Ramazzottius varieornatus TaxID=947166 RepID=A0A1D1W9G1_RAMVA|nr:hypothetical protein RvY_17879 [Ramazzottius varieornatus]
MSEARLSFATVGQGTSPARTTTPTLVHSSLSLSEIRELLAVYTDTTDCFCQHASCFSDGTDRDFQPLLCTYMFLSFLP